jgi:hypothetical protein
MTGMNTDFCHYALCYFWYIVGMKSLKSEIL